MCSTPTPASFKIYLYNQYVGRCLNPNLADILALSQQLISIFSTQKKLPQPNMCTNRPPRLFRIALPAVISAQYRPPGL